MKAKIFFIAVFLALAFCIVRETSAQSWAWAKSAGGIYYDEDYSCSADANGNIFVTGYFENSSITFGTTTLTNTNNTGTTSDIFTAKFSAVTGIESPLTAQHEISIYPNPFTASAVLRITNYNKLQISGIEFVMYDLLGRKVKRLTIDNSQITIHRDNLPSGMYLYKTESKSEGERKIIATGKIIIQ